VRYGRARHIVVTKHPCAGGFEPRHCADAEQVLSAERAVTGRGHLRVCGRRRARSSGNRSYGADRAGIISDCDGERLRGGNITRVSSGTSSPILTALADAKAIDIHRGIGILGASRNAYRKRARLRREATMNNVVRLNLQCDLSSEQRSWVPVSEARKPCLKAIKIMVAFDSPKGNCYRILGTSEKEATDVEEKPPT